MEQKLEERREDILHHTLGSGLMKLFEKRQRKRFLFGVMLNQFRQLGGTTVLTFFSTQIFNEMSGNGGTITLLI